MPIRTPAWKSLGAPESASYVLIRTPARKLFDAPESASYVPIRTPARKLFGDPESVTYVPIRTPVRKLFGAPELASYVPIRTPARSCSMLCFMLFLKRIVGSSLMNLVFTMGNRTPLRTAVLWQFTDKFAYKARKLRIGPLFKKILPLLIQPTLENAERHLLMKVIDRVLHELDEQPSIDKDYYAHVEGRDYFILYKSHKAKNWYFAFIFSSMFTSCIIGH